LSIVKEIALQHNLRVALESPYLNELGEPQSGTKISLMI